MYVKSIKSFKSKKAIVKIEFKDQNYNVRLISYYFSV